MVQPRRFTREEYRRLLEAGVVQKDEQVWLVNLEENRVEVYRNPMGGVFQEVRGLGPEDTLSPVAFPQVSWKAEEILP